MLHSSSRFLLQVPPTRTSKKNKKNKKDKKDKKNKNNNNNTKNNKNNNKNKNNNNNNTSYMGDGQPNKYYYGTQQQPSPGMAPTPMNTPNPMARMHTSMYSNLGQISKITLVKPADIPALYTNIVVTEPMLIQQQTLLFRLTPYWSYQLTTTLANGGGTWLVCLRFSHILKLEDKLQVACLGSILPPRPGKHATCALEEASLHQSAEFSMQRTKELEAYLNQLQQHPAARQTEPLRLFLGLQDDIGTAWPEVLSNALT
jgi:hypothetical protein